MLGFIIYNDNIGRKTDDIYLFGRQTREVSRTQRRVQTDYAGSTWCFSASLH